MQSDKWFQLFFIFTPKIGEDSHFDEYFSDGLNWNDQLVLFKWVETTN